MHQAAQRLLTRWHGGLGMPRHPRPWYRQRLREELQERRAARKHSLHRLSETADVLYIVSRARHDGHPLWTPSHRYSSSGSLHQACASVPSLALAYMACKYTSRWAFYRAATACLCGTAKAAGVREVVNPARDGKLRLVASRHGIEPAQFTRACRWLRAVWPLLP